MSTVEVSLGEIFDLAIKAIDENEHSKDAVYSYPSPRNLATSPLSIIVVDLDPDEDLLPSFASVNRAAMQNSPFTMQKVALVMNFAEQLKNNCLINHKNSLTFNRNFILSLIDSTDVQVVRS